MPLSGVTTYENVGGALRAAISPGDKTFRVAAGTPTFIKLFSSESYMRRVILSGLLLVSLISLEFKPSGQAPRKESTPMRPNMTGSYGPWLADEVLGDGPARLVFPHRKMEKPGHLAESRTTAGARDDGAG